MAAFLAQGVTAQLGMSASRVTPDAKFQTRIYYDRIDESDTLRELKRAVDHDPALPYLSVTDRPFTLRVREVGREIRMFDSGGKELTQPVPIDAPDAIPTLHHALTHWSRWFLIRNLANPNSKLHIGLEVRLAKDNTAVQDGQTVTLTPELSFGLSVSNGSSKPLFVYILDITSDGRVRLAFPEKGSNSALAARQELVMHDLEVTVPSNRDSLQEMLKVVATESPVDLSIVEMEQISKGPDATLAAGDWTTAHVNFQLCRMGHCSR